MANITARKRAEQAMFAEKERAQVTLQSIGDAVITTDREGRIDYMNPVAEQLSGWRGEEARGEKLGTVLRLLDEVTHRELENPLVRCLREGQLVHFAEHSVLRQPPRTGDRDPGFGRADPRSRRRDRRRRGGVPRRHQGAAAQARAVLSGEPRCADRTDQPARIRQSAGGSAAERAATDQGPHALLYVDLDQFKVVNDTCGHSAGDRLLRDVTGLLQAHVRARRHHRAAGRR